jgi:hypothetical protein
MRETFELAPSAVLPDPALALRRSGMVTGPELPQRFVSLLARASGFFAETAKPRGVLEEVTAAEFAKVYEGEGHNEPRTPVGEIQARAEGRALFAVTLGRELGRKIAALFEARDFAVGAILDTLASEAADAAAALAAEHWRHRLGEGGTGSTRIDVGLQSERAAGAGTGAGPAAAGADRDPGGAGEGPGTAGADRDPGAKRPLTQAREPLVLTYSPGYCGWHITGQRALFARLKPEEIGIKLTASCLMRPLKSVSGVILAGEREAHLFDDSYPFCDECADRPCRARIASLGVP